MAGKNESTPSARDLLAHLDDLLAATDLELEETELRQEQDRLRRVQELEQESDRIENALEELQPRRVRAEQLEAQDVLARLAEVDHALRQRRDAIRSELGYDPRERRRREFEERSSDRADELARRIGSLQGSEAAERMAESILGSLTELTLPDATRLATAMDERVRQTRIDSPAALHRLRTFLKKFAAGEGGEEQFRGEAPELAREQERIEELREEVIAIENEASLLETGLGKLSKPAIAARIHELACRGKLLQARHAKRMTDGLNDRMRRQIFGRLHTLVKDTMCGFVPSLQIEWMPDSLEAEIENARATFERAQRGGAKDSGDPERSEPSVDLRARLRQAEQWVLAEVYRQSNACFEDPGNEAMRERLRQAARFAIGFLDERRSDLARVLRHDADLFAEGSEFRWLRRRFAKHDETDEGEAEEPEDSGTIETLLGERVLHPSVLRARPHTQGRRVVMVGGAVRAERRARLQELFEAAEWEWVPYERGDGARGVQSLATRIRNGSPDVVVALLGFMTHPVFEQVRSAIPGQDVSFAVVPRGYGEAAIAEAILGARG